MPNKLTFLFAAALVLTACTSTLAEQSSERVQMGHDIRIEADENVSEATCFGCTVYVRGHVAGDVTTFFGNIVMEGGGQVAGDMTTIGGDVRMESGTATAGEVTAIGGSVRRDPGATIAGDVTSMGNRTTAIVLLASPFLIIGGIIAFIVWLVRRRKQPAMAHA